MAEELLNGREPLDWERVQITVVKAACYCPVAVDADGTPLSHGERMTETEPGVWADPVIAAAADFLESARKAMP